MYPLLGFEPATSCVEGFAGGCFYHLAIAVSCNGKLNEQYIRESHDSMKMH